MTHPLTCAGPRAQLSAYFKASEPSVGTGTSKTIMASKLLGSLYFTVAIVPIWISSYVELSAKVNLRPRADENREAS